MESGQPANKKYRGVARHNIFSRAYQRPTMGHNQGVLLELLKTPDSGFCNELNPEYLIKVVAGAFAEGRRTNISREQDVYTFQIPLQFVCGFLAAVITNTSNDSAMFRGVRFIAPVRAGWPPADLLNRDGCVCVAVVQQPLPCFDDVVQISP